MAVHLVDANLLIALVVEEHEHHAIAREWAASVQQLALCPIVEGALVRFLVRSGEASATAVAVLDALYATGRCEFWPDALGYRDVDMAHVVGHRQVTDAYLVALARSRDALVATFDRGLAAVSPDAVVLIA